MSEIIEDGETERPVEPDAPEEAGETAYSVVDGVLVPAAPEEIAQQAADRAAAAAPVPQEVSLFQARAAMRRHMLPDGRSLFTAVDEALRAARDAAQELPEDDPQRIDAEVRWQAWEYAAVVQRTSPLVAAMAQQCGLTDAEVDDLFRQAAAISA